MDPRDTQATVEPLSGSASPSTPGVLGTPASGTDAVSTILPNPVSGLCSRSTDQWTAGLASALQVFNSSCFDSNAVNDQMATLFRTPPLAHDLPIFGPIDARLYVSSLSGDGLLSVAVDDVAPDGSVSRLTGGWQVISLRALDQSRTRTLDGRVIQPYHPFTAASQAPAQPGEVVPVDVEVFPTGADIQAGHRLELSVQSFDVPHLLPTLPDALGTLSPIQVHASTAYPSALVLPTRDRASNDAQASPAKDPAADPTGGTSGVATGPGTAAPAADTAGPRVRVRVRGHRVIVKAHATGRVRLKLDGHSRGSKRLHHHKAVFRLPHLRTGTHKAKAIYLGRSRTRAVTWFEVGSQASSR